MLTAVASTGVSTAPDEDYLVSSRRPMPLAGAGT